MTTADLKNSMPTPDTSRYLIAGRYRTHNRIGRGRLGEIFAAIDEGYEELGVEQHLAIQMVPESVVRNNKLFNRLDLGYTVLRASAHPNIVNYLHFGRDGKFGFLVMELLDGVSLRKVLDDVELLALDEVKPVIRGVGEALRLLHAKEMVHGNLTTRNVFITQELEVRLLDVLPLDSSEAIMRGTATSEPFSRCTVEDDIFGLACLTYEMLAGKHPFNYTPPAEARLAELEADRITSLTDCEWNALHRALSFDREQRTSSIADFMRDFDIRGTERLRSTIDQPAEHETIAYPAVEEAPSMAQLTAAAHGAATAAPVAAVESDSWNENIPPIARPIHKGARPLRAVFLGMLLVGVSAWSLYGQPQEKIVNLISYIDESMNLGLTKRSDGIVEFSKPDSGRSVSIERSATTKETVATLAQLTDQPAPADSPKSDDTMGTSDEETNHTVDKFLADADADPMQTEPELGFTKSVVSVSERGGAARVAPLHTENLSTPLIWWTSEHTANADKDFISVEQQTIAGTSIEDSSMLHIPLVNDNIPEPPESFFVNLGLRDPQHGQIKRIATVRVDIIDDDLP